MQACVSSLAILCFLMCSVYMLRTNEETALLGSKTIISDIIEKSIDSWSVWHSLEMKSAIYEDFEKIKAVYPVSDIKIIETDHKMTSSSFDELIFNHSDQGLNITIWVKVTRASQYLMNVQNLLMMGSIVLIILISMLSFITYKYLKNEVFNPIQQIIRNMDPKTESLSLESNINAKGEIQDIVLRMSEVYTQAKVNHRQKVVSETVASIAHDLRKPFTMVNDLCNYVFKQSTKNPLLESGIKVLNDTMKHTDKMIMELLDPRINFEDFCGASDVIQKFAHQYKETSRFQIHTKIEQAVVRISECRLIRILENIVENAIQATEGKTLLDISVINRGTMAVLSIANTGSYISEEIRESIFERGYSSKSRSSNRYGLGLAIVKDIVEDAKGFVRCESKQGKGTKFMIHLPTVQG